MRSSVALKYVTGVLFIYFIVTILNTQLTPCPSKSAIMSQSHPRFVRVNNTSKGSEVNCEPVHIATWCHDVGTTRDVVSMLHTLLYHRTSALQLHLVVNSNSHTTLKLLFDTWQLPSVTTYFYIQSDEGIHTLTEDQNAILVQLPALLPGDLTKVIYASYNVRFLDDITKLWHAFPTSSRKVAGLVMPAQSPSNVSNSPYVHDLAVVNVQRLRPYNQTSTSLIEQFSQVLRAQDYQTKVIANIPCSWSVPLYLPTEELSSWDDCLQPAQAVIWSANANRFSGNDLIEDVKKQIQNILNSNGDLQRTTFLCGGMHTEAANHSDGPLNETCAEFKHVFSSKHRVHLNFLGPPPSDIHPDGDFDISAATQFTLDRLYMFERFAQNWQGPIVAVVYATDAEARQLVTSVEWSGTLRHRKNIAYHVAFKKQYYPINFLRNLGLNRTRTPYVIFVDVDLIPMPVLYPLLKGRLKVLSKTYQRQMLPVIPAFQAFEQLETFPKNKEELLELMGKGLVDGYRMKADWNLGHRPTNYPKWKTTNKLYVVKWQEYYEPYVVLPVKNVPLYHEPLLERMLDKIAYGMLLYTLGYDFLIQPDAFIIHLPHPVSHGTMTWRHTPSYSKCGARLYDAYKADLRKRYPDRKL